MRQHPTRRRAFSLLELLVVMGIGALVASFVLGGFSSYQGSQRRSTCQSNMVQIYRAARLYSNDNDSFPPTYTVAGQTQLSGGLGLLWAQLDPTVGGTGLKAPGELTSYLKTPNALHCPADAGNDPVTNQPVPQTALNAQGQINLGFLSYQKPISSQVPAAADAGQQTYLPIRTNSDPDFARQLKHVTKGTNGNDVDVDIPTPSNTVVTWCPFHRGLSGKPDTVLFFDGSVRRMEVTQPAGCLRNRPATTGWLRLSECSTSDAANNEGSRLAQPQ